MDDWVFENLLAWRNLKVSKNQFFFLTIKKRVLILIAKYFSKILHRKIAALSLGVWIAKSWEFIIIPFSGTLNPNLGTALSRENVFLSFASRESQKIITLISLSYRIGSVPTVIFDLLDCQSFILAKLPHWLDNDQQLATKWRIWKWETTKTARFQMVKSRLTEKPKLKWLLKNDWSHNRANHTPFLYLIE